MRNILAKSSVLLTFCLEIISKILWYMRLPESFGKGKKLFLKLAYDLAILPHSFLYFFGVYNEKPALYVRS